MRTLVFLASLLPVVLLALLVDAVGLSLTGPGRIFDPFLVATVWHAANGRRLDGMIAGGVLGLAQDSLGSVVFGIHYLSKVVIGYGTMLAARRLIPGQPATHAVLLAGATLLELVVFAAAGILLGQRFDARPWEMVALAVLANAVLGSLVFALAARLARRSEGMTHAARGGR